MLWPTPTLHFRPLYYEVNEANHRYKFYCVTQGSCMTAAECFYYTYADIGHISPPLCVTEKSFALFSARSSEFMNAAQKRK